MTLIPCKRLLLILAALGVAAAAQSPAMTTVSDAIFDTSVTIHLSAASVFTTADGFVIGDGWGPTVTSATGSFSLAAPPNPTGTYYIAHYATPTAAWSEVWVVPASSTPVRLAAVRALLPPSPSYLFPFVQIIAPANCIALGGLPFDTTSGWTCTSPTAGSGSVTSVGLAAPPWLAVTGSPVTTSGTLTFASATGQASHEVLGTFGGSSVALGPLAAADLPTSITSSTTGNAATATALATVPTQCPSTEIVTGVAANGNANCQDPLVSGPTAPGSAPGANNPVLVAGLDGTDVRTLLTDPSGRVSVNVNNTVPVTGTFWQTTQPVSLASLPALPAGSATIGAVTGTAADNTINSTAKLPVIPAVANAVAPSYTSGDQVPLSTDTGGNLRVTCANCSGGSGGTAMGDTGSFTQGTSSFTPVGGEYNSSPTSLTSGQAGAVLMTATRHLDVAVADALPAGGNLIGGVNQAQQNGVALGSPTAYGTAPNSGSYAGVNAFITNTPTVNLGALNGAALDSSVNGLLLGQGSTTSGQKGPLMLGAVTTAAPSYTTAQSSPLSLTLAGALRVDGSAVTQPVSGTFWQATQPVSLASLPALPTGSNTIGAVNQGAAGSSPWPMQPEPSSANAQAPTAFTSTSVTSAATIDSSAGNLFHYEATNTGTATCYVEFFNAASGSVTLGTTVPIWTVPLVASANNAYSRNSAPTVGALFSFATALSVAAVTTAGGSTTCPANAIVLNAGYK